MAKHQPRFFTKIWLGLGAVTGLALTLSTPASAETIDLVCKFEGYDLHVVIDTDRQIAVGNVNGAPYGPFAASISDTFIHWTQLTHVSEIQYTIDRVAGTIRYISISRGEAVPAVQGTCRRATQKF